MWRRTCVLLGIVGGCGGASTDATHPAVPKPPPPPPVVEPIEVSPAVLRGLLVDGEVALELTAADREARAMFRLCVAKDGVATVAELGEAPDDLAFTQAARAALAGWRFQPLIRDAVPRAACAMVAVHPSLGPKAVLPPPQLELPAPTIVTQGPPPAAVVPPTPRLALVVRCRKADGPPTAALVQSSGDASVDAALLYGRIAASPDAAPGCEVAGAFAGARPAAPGAAPAPTRPVLAADALTALRRGGAANPQPSLQARMSMAGAGVRVPARVCVDAAGRVDGVALRRSSGSVAYDLDLLNTLGGWQLRPYQGAGQATPVCGDVEFTYAPAGAPPATPLDDGW